MATTGTTATISFIRANNTWFNANEIQQITLVGDNSGVAHMIYGGGDDYLRLNMGGTDAAAITAINTLLDPIDLSTNVF